MKRLALSIAVLNCFAVSAFACWQTDWPRVVLATQSVNLRLTVNAKAQEARVFRLHKAITLNPKQKPPEQFYEKRALKSATTDSRGLASFGEGCSRDVLDSRRSERDRTHSGTSDEWWCKAGMGE